MTLLLYTFTVTNATPKKGPAPTVWRCVSQYTFGFRRGSRYRYVRGFQAETKTKTVCVEKGERTEVCSQRERVHFLKEGQFCKNNRDRYTVITPSSPQSHPYSKALKPNPLRLIVLLFAYLALSFFLSSPLYPLNNFFVY